MKKMLLIFLFVSSSVCFAKKFTGEGEISRIQAQSVDIIGSNTTYIQLNGFSQAGQCKVYSNGLVLMRIMDKDDRIYSLAIAAQMASKEVVISVDDQKRDTKGYCYARNIRVK